ncbi:MAG: GTPase ObgE [Spirochaetales bacterium]|nr:GTPase ObgE [Spirochaetales bacterium]
MQGFADETYIDVSSGDGGNGCISFRREKYVPRGGPDGGDGGKGGDIVFSVRNNLKTLLNLKQKRVYRAENGENGRGKRQHGKNGADAVIEVPPGTVIKDPETGKVLKDLLEGNWVFLRGGSGGKGNWHYKNSIRQAPRYAQPGLPGEAIRVHVELHLIADIGFVGFPNAGKSSLLGSLTNASPKVADYPFTTKIPYLGMLVRGDQRRVLADIPGLIEGASQGAGMGITFLRHVDRTKILAFIIDLSDDRYLQAVGLLSKELESFSQDLAQHPRIIVGTKLDLPGTEERYQELTEAYPKDTVLGVSVMDGRGLEDLARTFLKESTVR